MLHFTADGPTPSLVLLHGAVTAWGLSCVQKGYTAIQVSVW